VILPVYAQDSIDLSDSDDSSDPDGLSLEPIEFVAESTTKLSITLKDIKTNDLIKNLAFDLTAYNINTKAREHTVEYIDDKGVLNYEFSPGNWRLQIKVFNTSNDGASFFTERSIYIQKGEPSLEKTLYLSPVGTVEGVVYDSSGKLIPGAYLEFKCKQSEGADYPSKTNGFGSFKIDVIPVGECTISAAFDEELGATTIDITKGSLQTIEIHLKTGILKSNNMYYFIIPGIIIILVALILFFYFGLKKKVSSEMEEIKKEVVKVSEAKKENEKPKKEEENVLNPRARDIMKTLNDRERTVTQYLLDNDNSSSQAHIRTGTGIPKTSLVRVFDSLEKKKVLEIEKIAKINKVN